MYLHVDNVIFVCCLTYVKFLFRKESVSQETGKPSCFTVKYGGWLVAHDSNSHFLFTKATCQPKGKVIKIADIVDDIMF